MKKILLSMAALLVMCLGAKAQATPTYTTTASCGDNADWSSMTNVIPAASNLTVEVYGSDSIIVRNWCGVENYDICVTLDESGNATSAYPIVNGVANPYGNSGYWYLDTGLADPNPWIVAAYLGTGYVSVWNDETTQSGGIILSCYAYYGGGYSSSAWGYYFCGWGSYNPSPSTSVEPTYTATAACGDYADWSSMTNVIPAASNLTVEVYGSDSIIVRNWCGVENYDICVTLDESGNATSAYPIVNGVANPYGNSGYWYLDTGLADPNPWIVAAYLGTGYVSVWNDETTQSGGIILSCYAYYGGGYSSSAWGYYFCGWGSDEPTPNTEVQPTYTTTASCGDNADWSSMTNVIPAASNLNVEVYGSDSIIVRNWCGVENYDICVTLDESGNATSAYPIVNGVANPYGNGGYWYLDTGLADPNPWIIAAYLGTGFVSVWNDEATKSGGIIMACYAYYGGGYSSSAYGYYFCGWGSDEPTGINTVNASKNSPNAPMFNLAGQKVGNGAKGIVIKNGKKMVRK